MTDTAIDFRTVGPLDELADNWANPYYIAELKHRVAVARVGDDLFAFDDIYESVNGACPLTAGQLDGTVIMSQCDGSKFELSTGEVVSGPATKPLTTYEVRESDGQIQVRV